MLRLLKVEGGRRGRAAAPQSVNLALTPSPWQLLPSCLYLALEVSSATSHGNQRPGGTHGGNHHDSP